MKDINKTIKKSINLDYNLKISYNEALKDDSFNELVSKINLSDDILMKYTSKLEDSSLEYKNCKMCKNIFECCNSMSGYCFLPSIIDNKLEFSYHPCKYKTKIDEENKYQINIKYFDIPNDIKTAKIKEIYTDDNARKEVIKMVLNYLKDFKKGVLNKGFYLHGNFGCGKTYLISALINELAKNKVKCAVIYWPEYLRSLKSSFQSSSSDEFKNKYNEIKYSKVLLIDDLGAEAVTSWSRDEILGTILQYRMQQNLPTFITSNLSLEELEEHLSNTVNNKSEKVKASRIIERIKQLTVDVKMVSKNNRS